MSADLLPPSKAERAALAFSALPRRTAEEILQRLAPVERARLEAAIERLDNASHKERVAALNFLADNIVDDIEWPTLCTHDDNRCPFRSLATHQVDDVAEAFERIALREPLAAAAPLCHVPPDLRSLIWERLSGEARAAVLRVLPEANTVTRFATERIARDLEFRLAFTASPARSLR
jgi:flagellar motor switch protein FliG